MDENAELSAKEGNTESVDSLPLKRGIDTVTLDSTSLKNLSRQDMENPAGGSPNPGETTQAEEEIQGQQAAAQSEPSGDTSGASPTFEVCSLLEEELVDRLAFERQHSIYIIPSFYRLSLF
jgi:hypothetical protein